MRCLSQYARCGFNTGWERFSLRGAFTYWAGARLRPVLAMAGKDIGTVRVALAAVRIGPPYRKRWKTSAENSPMSFLDYREGSICAGTPKWKMALWTFMRVRSRRKQGAQSEIWDRLREQKRNYCRKAHQLAHAISLKELLVASWINTSVGESLDAELGPVIRAANLSAPQVKLHPQYSLHLTLAAGYSAYGYGCT